MLFHVPRTGVSSIIAALDDELFVRAPPTRFNKLMSKYVPIVRRPVAKTFLRVHETASHVRQLLPDEFASYRKIAFVRNPYSWLVSLYELVLQSPNHRHYDRIKAMSGFGDYVDWEIARNKRHQHPYLCRNDGRLMVDDVGRFEQLSDDFTRIFASIGVDIEPLPCVGKFTRRDYREFYDAGIRDKVARHWQRDITLFGYGFDGMVNSSPAA